jgi:hypothetical protein
VTNVETATSVLSSDDAPAGPAARWGHARRRGREARDDEFTAFVATAAPRLRRIAYLMCRDWHLAQDLTQITFAKMYASWGRIWQNANLDAYSRRVLLNAVSIRRSGAATPRWCWPTCPIRRRAGRPAPRSCTSR